VAQGATTSSEANKIWVLYYLPLRDDEYDGVNMIDVLNMSMTPFRVDPWYNSGIGKHPNLWDHHHL